MTRNEDTPVTLFESAIALGRDLASPNQTISNASFHLGVNLAVLGCEQVVETADIQGSWRSTFLTRNTEPFTRAVRIATSAIIFRPPSIVPTPPPKDINIDDLLLRTTEGSTWIDPAASKRRDDIAEQNATLLRGFILGMSEQGYPERASKKDMRAEFDEILDSLWKRGSYHCFPESKIVASIMRKAGISNTASSVHMAQRFVGFSRNYSLGLALTRLLPDEFMS